MVQTPLGLDLRAAAWGFRPVWVREDGKRPAPINARAETAATNGLFRDALEPRRRARAVFLVEDDPGGRLHEDP